MWKRFTGVTLIVAALFMGLVAAINFIVDPFWCFSHEIPIGKYQVGFDERQQKTNWLAFNDFDFDALIFGSSRVTYMDPQSIPLNAFNYSASSMKPEEFMDYAVFFDNKNPSIIKTFILGLGFFETNKYSESKFKKPYYYIKATEEFMFRIKSIFSFNLLRYSFSAISYELNGFRDDLYTRNSRGGVSLKQMILPVLEDSRQRAIKANMDTYKSQVYGENYKYLNNSNTYKNILKAFPDACFHVYVTPVTHHLLNVLIEENRWPDYERWLRDLVDVFGEVWNFMYFNEVSMNDKKYCKDAHHFTPYMANVIAKKMLGLIPSSVHPGFGIKITKESIEEDILFLRRNFEENYQILK